MKLLQVREQNVKRLQVELANKLKKQRWFADREISIEQESARLEEESKEVRLKGAILRIRQIDAFLDDLARAHEAMSQKKFELSHEIVVLQRKLEEAIKERKMVEKLEELHYNQRLQKRRRRGES